MDEEPKERVCCPFHTKTLERIATLEVCIDEFISLRRCIDNLGTKLDRQIEHCAASCNKMEGEKASVKLLIGLLGIIAAVLLGIVGFNWATYEKVTVATTNTIITSKELADLKEHINTNGIIILPEVRTEVENEIDDS